jgi:ketosteroid isomerase-like protein
VRLRLEFFDRISALETLQKYSTMPSIYALWRCGLLVIFSFFCFSSVSYATDIKELNAQFAKGVAYAQEGKQTEAIAVFSALIQSNPELPEPYNNLAVIYAEQGQYEKARLALEMAINTHPSYNTAHQNLGGIYARMASDAYDKALQVDRSSNHPSPPLEMIKEIVPVGSVKVAAIRPMSRLPAFLEPKSAVAPLAPKPPTVPVASEPGHAGSPKPAAKADSAPIEPSQAVLTTVQDWARAWSTKNVTAYLAFYAQDFKTPNDESRAEWAKGRELRIKKPVPIRVQVLNPKITVEGDHATVSFRQDYRAGDLSKRTAKVLQLKQTADKWLIEKEVADN